jgi:hypothetical protein
MKILVHCPVCATNGLLPTAHVLPLEAGMLFRCPGCRTIADVATEDAHPEHPRPGPPLDADDLLDLRRLLSDDRWCVKLVGGSS